MARKGKKKPMAPDMPPILAAEREQIRVRGKMGFPLGVDEFGRERVPTGMAEGRRTYDRSATGVVRLRLADPLRELKLSPRQRNAGLKIRDMYEAVALAGIKPASFDVKVDMSGSPRGIPVEIMDGLKALEAAKASIRHPQIISVVEKVCGLRMSIREIAEAEPRMTPRPALSILLIVGLDYLADHFYGRLRKSA